MLRWAEMSRRRRLGVIAAALSVGIVVLAAVSRLSGETVTPTPTATPTPEPIVEPTTAAAPPTAPPISTVAPTPNSTAGSLPAVEPLPQLPVTDNPDEYAVAVAEVVLGLNPRDHGRQEYLDLLLGGLGNFTDEARERLEPVIVAWLPDEYQWQRQRDYEQVHTFEAESVWVPQIVQENADQIEDAYQMRTVAGVQTTMFLDEHDASAEVSTPRLITVIAYCPGTVCSLVSIPREVQR